MKNLDRNSNHGFTDKKAIQLLLEKGCRLTRMISFADGFYKPTVLTVG
ncbi:MAG: hypothetical protein HOP08_13315 [Cyclobacteriaceae bacterium]|nr:hypothetical protein [Cyclobacteriaceae bacterium]